MSKPTKPLSPAEIRKLAKKIVSDNPIYIPNEPTTVGSPDNLNEKDDECDEQSTAKKSKRSKK